MADDMRWSVVLACPGEGELSLLADLSARRDARIVAVADPSGLSLGAELAAIMGIPVVADLSGIDVAAVDCLVHGPVDAGVAALLDEADALGLAVERSTEFAARLASPLPVLGLATAADPAPDQEHLERETDAIHRTLSRVEEALDRESLLRWLLGLAMRAVGASSGSLMLLDQASGELYLACDHGLSENTRHTTRVRPGEGIAGRVAETGRAERIRARTDDPARDRNDVVDAISAPIRWNDRLLGVVNVSNAAADGPLAKEALGLLTGLTHRLGLIMERFLRLQEVQDRERFRALDAQLNLDPPAGTNLVSDLSAWVHRLADAAGAAGAELGLLTADGDLCLVGPAGHRYESPPRPERARVLVTGVPAVTRTSSEPDASTYHLPVGAEGHRSVLTLTFAAAGPAHDFGRRCGEYLYLANRHLGHALALARRAVEVERLTALASSLSSLAEVAGDGEEARERVLAAARRLTGAGEALLLEERAQPDDDKAELRAAAADLLRKAGEQGWVATTEHLADPGDGPDESLSVLAVPLESGRPLPGLLMLGKERVHSLDALAFTADDALAVRRLLPLLRPRPAAEPVAAAPAPATARDSGTVAFLGQLRREMDRCDRYHTVVGLAAFRLPGPQEGGLNPHKVAAALARELRSTDQVGCLDDGTVVVIVPEEVQSLQRLQRRVSSLLQVLAGCAHTVPSAGAVYPGAVNDAGELIATVTRGLS